MLKFKVLYKIMMDDLKDASMIIDYAYEIKEEDKTLAGELAKYSKSRLDHFISYHKLFEQEALKKEINSDKRISDCMWEEAKDWYEKIERKIKKYE